MNIGVSWESHTLFSHSRSIVSQACIRAKDTTRTTSALTLFSTAQSRTVAWCRGAKIIAVIVLAHSASTHAQSRAASRRTRLSVVVSWK
jgi:hypothetical protein